MKHVTQPAITAEEAMFHFVVRKLIKQGYPALDILGNPSLTHHSNIEIKCAVGHTIGTEHDEVLLHRTIDALRIAIQNIHDIPAATPTTFTTGVKVQARIVADTFGFTLPLEAL